MKYVLTGGPNSGKTTIIEKLRHRGEIVIIETAREIIKTCGRKMDYDSFLARQNAIFDAQINAERDIGEGIVFCDRGLVDILAYSNLYLGEIPQRFNYRELLVGRYSGVFIFDRLPYVSDEQRVESGDSEAEKIHDELIRVYADLGYSPVRVPVFSVDLQGVRSRVRFILQRVKEMEGCLDGV